MASVTPPSNLPFLEPPPHHFNISGQELQKALTDIKKKALAVEIQRLWRGYKSRRGDITPCRRCQYPICLPTQKANGNSAGHCSWCHAYIRKVERDYRLWRKHGRTDYPPVELHYCGDYFCTGTCGELDCGCIDICRKRSHQSYFWRHF